MYRIGDLEHKRVLVTGASSGIGAALVEAFAQQGARVVLHFNFGARAANEIALRIRDAAGSAH